ncbi:MAG: hypothetical protein HQK72_03100 [Desulfamplus sp.]|nr:hypothetical protein [Desulfamplus sp.]
MSIIELDIEDKLIQEIGLKAIEDFMSHQLSLLRVQYLGEKINKKIKLSLFDHTKEVGEARKEAWEEYKSKYIMAL